MLRKGLLLSFLLLCLPALLSAYTIVLKNGQHLEAQEKYSVQGVTVHYTDAQGRERTVPLAEVDLNATEQANAPGTAATGKATRVWTSDDVDALAKREPVSVVGSAGAPATEGESAESGGEEGMTAKGGEKKETVDPEQTPEYWQKKLKPLRDELTKIDQELNALQSGQGKAASNAIDITGGNPGIQVEDTINRLKKRRAEVQDKIAAIQDEARRKGVPPGYVR